MEIKCFEHNMLIKAGEDHALVTLGEQDPVPVGKNVFKTIKEKKMEKRRFRCKDGEHGLDFYELRLEKGKLVRGKFLFSICEWSGIEFTMLEPKFHR